jgi:hypothetical protein
MTCIVDNCTDAFLLVNGEENGGGANLLMIYKLDKNYNIKWDIALPLLVNKGMLELDKEEKHLVITGNNSTKCPTVKMLASDGSISLQKHLTSVTN